MRALLLVVLVLAGPGSAVQPTENYEALLDRYYARDGESLTDLARWPNDRVRDVVAACLRSCPPERRLLAAVMHTDVAARVADDAPGLLALHTATARRYVDPLRDRLDEIEAVYEFLVTLHLSRGRYRDAAVLVEQGIGVHSRMGKLYELRGRVSETTAWSSHGNLRAAAVRRLRVGGLLRRWLQSAANSYERALGFDETLTSARLRLGMVRILIDGGGVEELQRVIEETPDDRERYLAYLFLGTRAERDRHLVEALSSYEEARAIAPTHLAACIAVSHVADALGREAVARSVGESCVTRDPSPAVGRSSDDPWLLYRLSAFDARVLVGLRSVVMRP